MYRTFIILGALVLGGCATTTAQSENWTRADGQPISPQQLALDKTACDGMVQKAPVSGLSGPPSRIYNGCMAERGWVAVQVAQ
jgi:PBP1b-binding outer membrane lipoprotein LpoB